MSFSKEKLNIMIRKKLMRIRPSIRLKATEGRTGWRYVFTVRQAREYHASLAVEGTLLESRELKAAIAFVPVLCRLVAADVDGGGAQPAPIKSALVKSNGAATNSRTLKIIAKMIEPAAAAVPPFFISSLARF